MMSKLVLTHYERLLKMALEASCDELCEMYLNQATGFAEYAYLDRHFSHAEFSRQTQRFQQIRLTRLTRGVAA